MKTSARILATALLVGLAGCASSPSKTGEGKPSSSTAAPADRTAPAVAIPTASTKKAVLAMTGPKTVVESNDWSEFRREWRETFAEHAKLAGVAFTFADADAKPTGQVGTLLLVQVDDYRIVGIGMRIMFGIMTGNAFIDANIFLDLKSPM